jgi:hypothetical protein
VAAVFERLGYNPEAGVKLFVALCEALARRREQLNRSVSGVTQGDFSDAPPPVLPPPSPPVTSTPRKPGILRTAQPRAFYYHDISIRNPFSSRKQIFSLHSTCTMRLGND